MAKQLTFHDEARRRLKAGIDKTAQAITTTLGPKGRHVAIDQKWGSPTITHDGVTIAREIALADRYENMGAQLLKAAATKTSNIAGDGATTAYAAPHPGLTVGEPQTIAEAGSVARPAAAHGEDTESDSVPEDYKSYRQKVKEPEFYIGP